MADRGAVLLLLLALVSSPLFLLHEAQPLHYSTTKEDMVTVVRKGSSGRGVGNGGGHGEGGGAESSGGKSIPSIAGGLVFPKTSTASSHEKKHNAAHSSCNFSIAALLIISAFWLEYLACLYSHSY